MNNVPGELTVSGDFLGKEIVFAVWLGRLGLDGLVIKPNLALISCPNGKEQELVNSLSKNKPEFIYSIHHTEIPQ